MLDSQTKDAKADIKTGLAKFASRQDRLVDAVDSQILLLVTESLPRGHQGFSDSINCNRILPV
jgi:hypothetical protein